MDFDEWGFVGRVVWYTGRLVSFLAMVVTAWPQRGRYSRFFPDSAGIS